MTLIYEETNTSAQKQAGRDLLPPRLGRQTMRWFVRLADDQGYQAPVAGPSAPPDRKLLLEEIRGLADQLSDDQLLELKSALQAAPEGPEGPLETGLEIQRDEAAPYDLEQGDPIDRWVNIKGRPRPLRREDELLENYTPEQRLRMERHRVPIDPSLPVGHPEDYPLDPLGLKA